MKSLVAAIVISLLAGVGLGSLIPSGETEIGEAAPPPLPLPQSPPEVAGDVDDPVAPEPPGPNDHPLAGRKDIVSASPGNWRHARLSFSDDLADVEFPLATVKNTTRCVWELVGESGYKNVYRIVCRPRDGKAPQNGNLLAYSLIKGEDFPLASLKSGKNDAHLWEITPLDGFSDRYLIRVFNGEAWNRKPLACASDHDFGSATKFGMAAVGEGAATAWMILPEGDEVPPPPGPVTHVIIFPRKAIAGEDEETLKGWADDMVEHLAEDGPGVFQLRLTLANEDLLESACEGFDFKEAAAQLSNQSDPLARFLPRSIRLPGIVAETGAGVVDDIRSLAPFPLVFSLKEGEEIHVESIRTLLIEDVEFTWSNKLEKVEDFQSKLDDLPGEPDSDGRVFHGGKFFTYVFVHLDEKAPEPSDE